MYETEMLSIPLPQKLRWHHHWVENANAWGKFLGRHNLPSQPSEATNIFDRPLDIYHHIAERKGASFGGEKSPTFMSMIPRLLREFPDCKIITILRHPIHIYASVQQAAKKDNFFSNPRLFALQVFLQERLLKDAFLLQQQGKHIHHITYDELVADTKATCAKMCDYLQLPYSEKMTSLEGADLSAVYTADHHIKLHAGKITPRELQAHSLSTDQQALMTYFWQRWQRMHEALRSKDDYWVFSEPLSPAAAALVKQGRTFNLQHQWKRSIYHLLPGETIRLFRAIKIMLREVKDTEQEVFTPQQITNNKTLACISSILLICAGVSTVLMSTGDLSPLLFFILAPISVGWLAGNKAMVFIAFLSSLTWTLSMAFITPEHSLWILVWNLLARFTIFFIAGIFSKHLKFTLLRFQQAPQ